MELIWTKVIVVGKEESRQIRDRLDKDLPIGKGTAWGRKDI